MSTAHPSAHLFWTRTALRSPPQDCILFEVEQYALARLGRLVGGPYTGTPDVASLLQLEEGSNQAITMRKGDPKAFAGDLSVLALLNLHISSIYVARDMLERWAALFF